MRTAWASVGAMTGKPSLTACGEPGKLTISDVPAIPETPRESIPWGVIWIAAQRSASAKPGASRGDHRARGLGRDVVGRQPGAAGGEDEVAAVVDEVVEAVLDQREVVGTTSIATTSQPASSASAASIGPDSSSASRRETDVETVRTAVRMASRDGRRVRALGGGDQVEHGGLVALAQQRDRVGVAVDDALEERLAVLVGGQRALGPAADVVEQHREPRVGLAVLLGDLGLDALGERRRGARRWRSRSPAGRCARSRAG